MYLAESAVKNSLQERLHPPQLEGAILGQLSQPLLLPPPAKSQTWKSLSRAGRNDYLPPRPAPADSHSWAACPWVHILSQTL